MLGRELRYTEVFYSYFCERQLIVTLEKSKAFQVCLGPILFLIFINDILKCITTFPCFVVCRTFKTLCELAVLIVWSMVATINRMHLKISKCQGITFFKEEGANNFDYTLHFLPETPWKESMRLLASLWCLNINFRFDRFVNKAFR